MNSLVTFLLTKKIQAIPKWPNIARFTLYTLSALVGGLINGLGLAALIDIVSSSPAIALHQVLSVYCMLFGFFLFLLDLYPVPKIIGGELPTYYPLEAIDKLKISMTFSLLRHFIFFIVLMHALIIIMSSSVGIEDGVLTFILMMSYYLTNRTFVNLVAYEVQHGFLITVLGIALVAFSMLLYWFNGFSDLIFLSIMLVFLAIFILYVLTEVKRKTKVKKAESAYRKTLFMRMFSRKEVKVLLLMAFTLKIACLGMFAGSMLIGNSMPDGYNLLYFMIASPLIIFTYMGLNFFGIHRSHFFTHILRTASLTTLFRLYARFMLILGTVDFLIYLIFIKVVGQFDLKSIFFYLSHYIFLFSAGYILSLRFPVIRENFISFDFTKNASTISLPAIIVGFLSLALCLGITYLDYYMVYYAIVWILSGVSLYLWKPNNSIIGQRMFQKMKSV